jgi:hypothetical protein
MESAGGESQAELLQKLYGLNATITEQWAELAHFSSIAQHGQVSMTFDELVACTPTAVVLVPLCTRDDFAAPPGVQTQHASLLHLELTRQIIAIERFTPAFGLVQNVFNETLLPTFCWIDLSSVLAKYEDLRDTEKTCTALRSWKKGD